MVKTSNISIADAISEAEESMAAMPVITGTTRVANGICSLSIVNSETNGKRISFSKALSAKLDLSDKVSILPNIKTGELIVSKKIKSEKAYHGKLSGKDKKLCYNASMVQLVTQAFGLDFSERVSRSFSTIRFLEDGDDVVAFITLSKDTAQTEVYIKKSPVDGISEDDEITED